MVVDKDACKAKKGGILFEDEDILVRRGRREPGIPKAKAVAVSFCGQIRISEHATIGESPTIGVELGNGGSVCVSRGAKSHGG